MGGNVLEENGYNNPIKLTILLIVQNNNINLQNIKYLHTIRLSILRSGLTLSKDLCFCFLAAPNQSWASRINYQVFLSSPVLVLSQSLRSTSHREVVSASESENRPP